MKSKRVLILLLISIAFLPIYTANNQNIGKFNLQKSANSEISTSQGNPSYNVVLVLLNTTLDSKLNLTTFLTDVQNALKCNVTKYAFNNSWNCTQLKNFLITHYYNWGLRGAIFIGQVPNFTYNHTYYIPPPTNFQFSWDYWYMDLNGIWGDADGDFILDTMMNNNEPEIWVSRIDASHLTGNETAYYEEYFIRNHLVRDVGSRGMQHGLLWADDTWGQLTSFSLQYLLDFKQLYPDGNWTLYDQESLTNRSTYLSNVSLNYEWLWACIHSNSSHHHFEENRTDPPYNLSSYIEINQTQKNMTFYNVYCCSTGDYCVNDYLAGYYIFGNINGQMAIACPRSGGFYVGTSNFYRDLGWGLCVGDAWRDVHWYAYQGYYGSIWVNGTEGTNLFGDPTLRNCKVNTTVAIDTILNITRNSNITIVAQIHDKDLWYLYGVTLQFEIHNGTDWITIGSSITDNNGKAFLVYNVSNKPLGTRQVRVTYAGDPNFYNGSDTETFTILSSVNPPEIPIEHLVILLAASGQSVGITDILFSPFGIATVAAGTFVIVLIIVFANKKRK